MTIETTTVVTCKVITSSIEAATVLRQLPSSVACDFEAKSKYTKEQKDNALLVINNPDTPFIDKITNGWIYNSTALHHPSYVKVTHLSIAINDHFAYVFVFNNNAIWKTVLNWLVSTTTHQIWHNASYDLKLIHYYTGLFPKNFDDTRVMAKSLLNHRLDNHCNVKLKSLKGYKYGKWAVAKDVFENVDLLDPDFLLYAATDACATYDLYYDMIAYGYDQS